jgi:hypothetical protein
MCLAQWQPGVGGGHTVQLLAVLQQATSTKYRRKACLLDVRHAAQPHVIGVCTHHAQTLLLHACSTSPLPPSCLVLLRRP